MDKFSLNPKNGNSNHTLSKEPLDINSLGTVQEESEFDIREVQRPMFMEKPINNFSSSSNRKRIIAVSSSGKGGTGKSTTSMMLSLMYQQLNQNTVLVDLDIPFGDISSMLGMSKERCISDFVNIPEDLSDIKVRDNMLLTYYNGLKVLPSLREITDQRLINNQQYVDKLLRKLDSFETIIIDLGPNFEAATVRVLERATDIIYVTDDSETTFHNMAQGYQTLERLGIDGNKVRLVINKSIAEDDLDEQVRGFNAQKITNISKVNFLPFVKEMPQYVDNSHYLVLDAPNHPYRASIVSVVNAISPELFTAKNAELVDRAMNYEPDEEIQTTKHKRGFFARIFGREV